MLRAVVLALCVHQAASFCGPALPLGGSLRKATSCAPMMVSSEDGGRRAALGRVGLALAAPFLPLSPLVDRASAAEAGQVTKVEDVDRGYSFEYPAGMVHPTPAVDCFCCLLTFLHRESVCGEMETYELRTDCLVLQAGSRALPSSPERARTLPAPRLPRLCRRTTRT